MRLKRFSGLIFIFCMTLILPPAAVQAFSPGFGDVTGTVQDGGGNAVGGAVVEVSVTGAAFSANTAMDGTFLIQDIPEGAGLHYSIRKPGYNLYQNTVDVPSNAAIDTGNHMLALSISSSPPVIGFPDLNFTPLPFNYASGSQQIRDVTFVSYIYNDIGVHFSGAGASAFETTQPGIVVIGANTTFPIRAKAGLLPGTYTATVSLYDGSAPWTVPITFMVTQVVNPPVPADISPTTVTYDLNNRSDVNTVITWNDATTVSGISSAGITLTPGAVYGIAAIDAFTSNLAVKDGYLNTLGLTAGDTVIFDIDFDLGDELLTVNVIDTAPPPPPPVPPSGGGGGSVEQPPSGPLVDRMPGFVPIGKPVKISRVLGEIVLDYDKTLLAANTGHEPRAYYWNTRYEKWVALATYSAGNGKVKAVNDNRYQGWFTVFGVVQPFFTDIASGHEGEQIINRMNGLGIVEGYMVPDGSLNRPVREDQSVTRMEYAMFLSRLLNMDPDKPLLTPMSLTEAKVLLEGRYSDAGNVPGWAVAMLGAIVNKGLLVDRNGTIAPDLPVTRIEAAVMTSKTLEALPGYQIRPADLTGYPDSAEVPEWAGLHVAEGVLSALPDGRLDPNGEIPRDEAIENLLRLFVTERSW